MWSPPSFRANEIDRAHELIESHSFGVVMGGGDAPTATHLPFLLQKNPKPFGTLVAHMARANPHWQSWDEGQELLVVFSGPHCYVSPAWYVDPMAVPTWNYAAVHVYGRPKIVDDRTQVKEMVRALSVKHEAEDSTWSFERAAPVIDTLLDAIVGFEIEITRFEAKFKLHQNHPDENRRRVAHALAAQPSDDEKAISVLMKDALGKSKD